MASQFPSPSARLGGRGWTETEAGWEEGPRNPTLLNPGGVSRGWGKIPGMFCFSPEKKSLALPPPKKIYAKRVTSIFKQRKKGSKKFYERVFSKQRADEILAKKKSGSPEIGVQRHATSRHVWPRPPPPFWGLGGGRNPLPPPSLSPCYKMDMEKILKLLEISEGIRGILPCGVGEQKL